MLVVLEVGSATALVKVEPITSSQLELKLALRALVCICRLHPVWLTGQETKTIPFVNFAARFTVAIHFSVTIPQTEPPPEIPVTTAPFGMAAKDIAVSPELPGPA